MCCSRLELPQTGRKYASPHTYTNLHTHVRSVWSHTHTIFLSRRKVVAVDQDVTVIDPDSKASAVQENLVGITARATAFVAEVAWLLCHGWFPVG